MRTSRPQRDRTGTGGPLRDSGESAGAFMGLPGYPLATLSRLIEKKSPGQCRIRFRAVSLYRSKSTERLAGAVLNSYPNVDLRWDNVYAGAMGMAPALQCKRESRPVAYPLGGSGTLNMPTG